MMVSIPKAGGDLAYAASLHLALGLLSLITTPVTLALLSDALNFPLEKALPVFIPYLVVFAIISLLYIRASKYERAPPNQKTI